MWADPKKPEAPVEYVVAWSGTIAAQAVKADQKPPDQQPRKVPEKPGATPKRILELMSAEPDRAWSYRQLALGIGIREREVRRACARLKDEKRLVIERIPRIAKVGGFTEVWLA